VKPRPWSLWRRLVLALGVATLVASGVGSAWLYKTAVRQADQMFDDALDHTAHAVLAVVRNEASELTETSEGVGFELAVIDKSDQNDIVYQVRGPNGVMVYRSHGAPVKPLAGAHDRGFSVAHVDGQDFRVFSLATELDAATIHVAQPMARRIEWMHASVARLLVPGVALMIALVLVVVWTVRKVTRPLVRYAGALDDLVLATDTSVDGTGLPVELQPVSRAIDRLLAKVHESLVHERTLTADAAHELRNPLAAMRLQAQIARRSKQRAETNRALTELLTATDRAARMVDSILALARLDARTGVSIGDGDVQIGHLVQVIVGEFTATAELRGIRITTSIDDSSVLGDEDALAIALRNLLNNALRFARASVAVDVAHDQDLVTVTVRDDGPGFTEESKRRAFHRFFRGLEEGRASDGAGLGLALVLRVAQLHEGSVEIVPGIEGGAGVAMHLPLRSVQVTVTSKSAAAGRNG
jgi:two-component system, OmpR family, sensor histidine kinase QseC